MTVLIGVDVGTSGAKATLVEVTGDVAVERRTVVVTYNPGDEPCRDPARWVSATLEAVDGLDDLGDDEVEGIGFTGQMHALVAVDERLQPLRPAMLWLDYQGDIELERFVGGHTDIDIVRRTGNLPLPDFTLAKWLYALNADPDMAGEARAIMGAKDYVRTCLCADAPFTDINEAAGTQFYDPFERHWAHDVLTAAGVPEAALPEVVPATMLVGDLSVRCKSGRARYVVVGTGDQAAASRGVGALQRGVVSLSLGTSGVAAACFHLEHLPGDWDGRFHLFPLDDPGEYQLIGTVPSVGPTLRWLARLTNVSLHQLAALASGARRADVHFFPYLGGRGAPNADSRQRGALMGLTDETTPADIAEAVYRGIGLEFASMITEMLAMGVSVEHVICSGGAALDLYLVETIATCLDVPCSVAAGSNASAVGAALLAHDAVSPGTGATLGWHAARRLDALPGTGAWREQREMLIGAQHGGERP